MAFPRMTTQGWMAGVAGVALGLSIAGWRVEEARRRAARYQQAYRHAMAVGLTPQAEMMDLRPSRREYHRRMMRKWLDASRHPWAPVAPDPPEPQF